MKDTGVIRRVDELGRIVVPKEIRKQLKIDNGDAVDISINNGKIIMEKHHPLDEKALIISYLLSSYKKIYDVDMIVCDNDHIIASTLNSIYPGDLLTSDFKKRINNNGIEDCIKISTEIVKDTLLDKEFYYKEIRINSDVYGYLLIFDTFNIKRSKDFFELIYEFICNLV